MLFHHIQGLTDGVHALAGRFREAGHTVHTPDLFDGVRTATIEEGAALTKRIGHDVLDQRAAAAVDGLPAALVFAGISSGVMRAQRYAQTRGGARGALLYEACLPISGEWAVGPWPAGVRAQVHGMEKDPFFGLEGDLDAARELVAAGHGELYVYPGDRHLFTDSSLPSYDKAATDLVVQRSLEFLAEVS